MRAGWLGKMAGAAGLEPTHAGVKVPCLTDLATPQHRRLAGISITEPSINCQGRAAIPHAARSLSYNLTGGRSDHSRRNLTEGTYMRTSIQSRTQALPAAQLVWEALDYSCAERLHPVLLSTAERLATHGELFLTPEVPAQPGQTSAAQLWKGGCGNGLPLKLNAQGPHAIPASQRGRRACQARRAAPRGAARIPQPPTATSGSRTALGPRPEPPLHQGCLMPWVGL